MLQENQHLRNVNKAWHRQNAALARELVSVSRRIRGHPRVLMFCKAAPVQYVLVLRVDEWDIIAGLLSAVYRCVVDAISPPPSRLIHLDTPCPPSLFIVVPMPGN
ncbi:unnamed protein product [Sphacelaria rigidula]